MYRLTLRSDTLRDRSGLNASRVTSLELFFDLVFVFAITQLSHTLLGHLSVRGALEITVLLMATWWMWMYTTWATNWVDPQSAPIRLMLVLLMFGGLVFSTSIPGAFGDTGLTLAIAYSVIQIGRTLFLISAFIGRREHLSMVRIALWFAVSAPIWLAGALAEGDARLILWGVALAIDYVAPSVGYRVPRLGPALTTDWDISPAHMAERCGLFIIIALGESVLVAGATFTDLERTFPVVASFVAAFAGSVTLWWIYFGTIADQAAHHFEKVTDPGSTAIVAYTYLHLPIVAGIIVVAVGDELVLAHPEGHSDLETILTVVGGAMLFLLGTLLFKVVSAIGRFPVSHVIGLGLLLVLIPLAGALSPLTLSLLTTGILFVVGGAEAVANRRVGRLGSPAIQA